MPLATKNGSLILKDGRIAENCGCCASLCETGRTRATLTLSGLPSTCTPDPMDNRDLDDDSCSYTLFRIRNLCRYSTVWHTALNDSEFSLSNKHSATIDVPSNLLTLNMFGRQILLRPPDGKSFDSFPFEETLLPVPGGYPGGTPCSLASFEGVRVRIDDSAAAYFPFEPPAGHADAAAGIDYHVAQTSARVGNVRSVVSRSPVYSCDPCDLNNYSEQTQITTFTPGCVQTETRTCVESVSESSSWPELQLEVAFTGETVRGRSYSALSGSYSLKWKPSPVSVGFSFPRWSVIDANQDPASPFFGVGRSQLDYRPYLAPSRTRTEQGWGIDYRTNVSGVYWLGMLIVVAPVKFSTNVDVNAGAASFEPCGHGEISYQVRLSVFSSMTTNFPSYIYWTNDFSCFANVPCAARQCGAVPSVSLSETADFVVPDIPGFGTAGRVSVSVSS